MPAEWEQHAGCLMAWPARQALWDGSMAAAKREYAAVARAVAAFEPVTMVCNPGQAREVRDYCGADVEPLEIPIDDSWARDSGPIFVRNGRGEVAVVSFRFNAWGGRWHPHDSDDLLPRRVAEHLGMHVFEAPFVLEGGALTVDGLGTLITTEQCLLNPNRNPGWSREDVEQGLAAFLGVDRVIWLEKGHSSDVGPAGTDGHVDGVAAFIAPGRVLLEVPSSGADPDHANGLASLRILGESVDSRGIGLHVTVLDPGQDAPVSYANYYTPNGGVVVTVAGDGRDDAAMEVLRRTYPDRDVVGVPGLTIARGGGGAHCITQQIPAGPPAAFA
jgi:agmatine deiminase